MAAVEVHSEDPKTKEYSDHAKTGLLNTGIFRVQFPDGVLSHDHSKTDLYIFSPDFKQLLCPLFKFKYV